MCIIYLIKQLLWLIGHSGGEWYRAMSSEREVEKHLWAKKDGRTGTLKWLPLYQHLIDTMNVSELLWEHWLDQGQRDFIAKSLDKEDHETAKRLVIFLSGIHDLGKSTAAFQTKESFYLSKDLDQELLERLERNGFPGLSSVILPSRNKSPHALAGETLLSNYGVRDDIGSIIGGHHGRPLDDKQTYRIQLEAYTSNYFQTEDKESLVYQKWQKTQKSYFLWALERAGFGQVDELPHITQAGQVILEGLLILSDWVASNENYFPLIPLEQEIRIDQDKRKKAGWLKWFKTFPWSSQQILNAEEIYDNRFGYKPKEFQVKFLDIVETVDNPGIFVVEAPMGMGKTEAALVAVEQLARKTGHSGMYFGLPTQATSNGIFPRVESWLSKLSQSDGEDKSLQLLHGKAALNDDFKGLAQHIDVDGESHGSVVVNEWFSGRKTAILDDFVVGTIDQFLLLALKQKHLALRHLGFSKKVVVIDEVHAYDAYMGQYLYQALRWMGVYDIPVIILSATLPAKRRVKLIESYIRGTGEKWKKVVKPENWETQGDYPLITYSNKEAVRTRTDFELNERKEIKIQPLSEENITKTIENLIVSGGVIGIIVNTVKRAQELAKKLIDRYGEETIELLHSSFIASDRARKERNLLSLIGKKGTRPDQKIIIGTQVIEQSLDIDFDVLISDLAPMDLLLQRIGRLHRHVNVKRPKKLNSPVLYVLGLSDEFEFNKGSVAVYGEYLLMRTQLLLPEVIELPTDISHLVQAVYGEENLSMPEQLFKQYEEARQKQENMVLIKEDRAKSFMIDRPNFPDKNSLIGWLKNVSPDDSQERGLAQVRDSGDSIEVIALKKVGHGYGTFEEQKDLSTSVTDFKVGKKLATQTLRLPNPLCAFYAIDKTIDDLENRNRNTLKSWQEQPWLKGTLGLVFDEENQASVNGYKLSYSQVLGLIYEKEVKNE